MEVDEGKERDFPTIFSSNISSSDSAEKIGITKQIIVDSSVEYKDFVRNICYLTIYTNNNHRAKRI